MCRRYMLLSGLVFGVGLLVLTSSAQQGEPRNIHHFGSEEVSSADLIDLMRVQEGKIPGKFLTRSSTPVPVECGGVREQLSRGIDVRPVAAIPALDLLFAVDSDKISPEAASNLDQIGKALGDYESGLAFCCIAVEGHTDSTGTAEHNRALSVRRAKSVAAYLEQKFDISPSRLLIQGRGEDDPLSPTSNETSEGRQKNRRVQLVNYGYGEE